MPSSSQAHPNSSERYSVVTVGTSKKRKGRTVKKVVSISTGDPALLSRHRPISAATRNAANPPILELADMQDPFPLLPELPSEPLFPSSDFDGSFGVGQEEDEVDQDEETGQGGDRAADGEGTWPDDSDVHIVNCGSAPPRRKRLRESAYESWIPHRDETLRELFVLDGFHVSQNERTCSNCSATIPSDEHVLRCLSCLGSPVCCILCTIKMHQRTILHRIEAWNGDYWESKELSSYGLTCQLGHNGDAGCDNPGREDVLTIIDVTGHHHVNVRFCRCSHVLSEREERNQLLHCRFFPASFKQPKTAFTFQLLDLITIMIERGKSSVYDFHLALRFLTDACELSSLPRRYLELTATVRRYRDMFMHKRAGRGHVPDGIKTTAPGELAVQSPALPYPDRNMPSDWRTKFHDKPHLKAIYPSLDANFRLKEKDKPSRNDPGLVAGGAFFGADKLLAQEQARVEAVPPPKPAREKSTCDSSFSAIERADTRINRGFTVTGVVATIDARYGFLFPTSAYDLKKGERYVNSDLSFLSALQGFRVEDVFVSYDIACRWGIHSKERWSAFPIELHGNTIKANIRLAVPKFHLPAHGASCWSLFSWNYIFGGGRVDGEAIERFWAISNLVAASTREMGHGMRHDYLDGRWNMWNFMKLVDLGGTMSRRLSGAVKGLRRHSQEFREFSASFAEKTIADWTKMVSDYHEDPMNSRDPYQSLTREFSIADVEKELRAEEANAGSSTGGNSGQDNSTLTELDFIIKGLDIEHDQRKLRLDRIKRRADDADIVKRREALGRRVNQYLTYQGIFMPGVSLLRVSVDPASLFHQEQAPPPADLTFSPEDDEDEAGDVEDAEDASAFPLGTNAEDIELYLPSHAKSIADSFASPSLVSKELRLRKGRLEAHLKQLRRLLRIKAAVYIDKTANSIGQKAGTRSNTMLAEYTRKIDNTSTHYREERAAALRLDPMGSWQTRLQELKKVDVRPVSQNASEVESEPFLTGTMASRTVWRQGQRSISWIWRMRWEQASVVNETSGSEELPTEPVSASEEELGEALQVEWAKAYARVNRYQEEQELVVEEMKRVRRYFVWRIRWWKECASGAGFGEEDGGSPKVISGRLAYANKQIGFISKLDSKFAGLWRSTLRGLDLDAGEIDQLD